MLKNALGILPLMRFLPDIPMDLVIRLPARLVTEMMGTILANLQDEKEQEARNDRARRLPAGLKLATTDETAGANRLATSDESARSRSGQTILTLYFHQLFTGGSTFVDTAKDAVFIAEDGLTLWNPAPLFFDASPLFTESVSLIYQGLYEGQPELFDKGLRELNVEPMKDIFLEHFGSGDLRGLEFKPARMKASFQSMIGRMKELPVQPSTDLAFLALSLFCLYDGLQHCGPLDAMAAYGEARSSVRG